MQRSIVGVLSSRAIPLLTPGCKHTGLLSGRLCGLSSYGRSAFRSFSTFDGCFQIKEGIPAAWPAASVQLLSRFSLRKLWVWFPPLVLDFNNDQMLLAGFKHPLTYQTQQAGSASCSIGG
ncbi:MAG: hypothetical protein ACX936_04185 [Marinobacter sp.]